jgi:hypothetical protein
MELLEDAMMFEIMKKGCTHIRADVVTVQQPQIMTREPTK